MIQIDRDGHLTTPPPEPPKPASNNAAWTLVVLTAINLICTATMALAMLTVAMRIEQAAQIVAGIGCSLDPRNC